MTLLAGEKDPDDVADYDLNWAANLAGDTIVSSAWIAPVGITIDSDSNTETITTARLSGGTDMQQYDLVNRVTTAGGQQLDQTLRIYVRQH